MAETKVKQAKLGVKTVMRTNVKTVALRGNVAVDKFQHVHLELIADVGPDQDVSEVIQDLSLMIVDELKGIQEDGDFKRINLNY